MNTKRKIFIGGAALAAVSLVGAGTFAFFSDTEVSANQSLTAGTLDLEVSTTSSTPASATPNINLVDRKPSDTGNVVFQLNNSGSLAGNLTLNVVQTSDAENGCNEPEDIVDEPALSPGCGATGELDSNLNLTVSDGTIVWSGTLADLAADADGNAFGPIAGSAGKTITVTWAIPEAATNIIQSDRVEFHLAAALNQA